MGGKCAHRVAAIEGGDECGVRHKVGNPVRARKSPTRRQAHKIACHADIRAEVRKKIGRAYQSALTWGRTNLSQHAAIQAMWAQYDHLVPHTRSRVNPSRRAGTASNDFDRSGCFRQRVIPDEFDAGHALHPDENRL